MSGLGREEVAEEEEGVWARMADQRSRASSTR